MKEAEHEQIKEIELPKFLAKEEDKVSMKETEEHYEGRARRDNMTNVGDLDYDVQH